MKKAPAGYDLVSIEARENFDGWSVSAQKLFRELLNRAVAAAHTGAEVHAFADALRALSDKEAFKACTPSRESTSGYSVVQLLKAEADPLFAFQLQGGELSPTEEAKPQVPTSYAPPGSPARARPGVSSRDLGASPDDARPARRSLSAASAESGAAGGLMQDLLNDGLANFELAFTEFAVDGHGRPRLDELLPRAASALQRGLPVVVALGPSPGNDRTIALVLQLQQVGKNRAFQLFEVVTQELAWVNEGDLLARAELPFSAKQNRRITRIAIPQH